MLWDMTRFATRFLLALCCAFALSGHLAHAQIFATPQAAPASIEFGAQNPELKKLLDLQYQLQLLKRLIEHQKAVNGVVQSAVSIGAIDPAIPAPSRELCESVPANIPCAQSWPDMYKGFSVEIAKPLVPVTPPSADIASVIPAMQGEALPQLPDSFAGADLFWTDITCLGSKCSAIISPEPQNPAARYRISPGETLPDGAVISAISAAGVTIQRGKKTIQLDPAPQG